MTSSSAPAHGLTAAEARAGLEAAGPHELARVEGPSAARLLLRQLSGLMTWLLVGACVISQMPSP